jgi:hypothetical protein
MTWAKKKKKKKKINPKSFSNLPQTKIVQEVPKDERNHPQFLANFCV